MKLKVFIKLKFVLLLLATISFAQDEAKKTIDIKGVVKYSADDKAIGVSKGEGVIGATIAVEGTSRGTVVNDVDGNFTLKDVPIGSKLTFNFSGLKKETVLVDGSKTDFEINMTTDAVQLIEVVSVGYGYIPRSQVNSSNVSVSRKSMEQTINVDAASALQGRAAGVNVTQTSGAPGAASSVNIRGVGSINGSQPLYVIDGVPLDVSEGNLSNFNPADFESMEVLKDAAATAIYGSRGSNGVVIITTKRGKSGKGRIEFDAMAGIQNVWNKLEVLNADQYKAFMKDVYTNSGDATATGVNQAYTTKDPAILAKQGNTNWLDQLLQTGSIQNYNIRASGGNENANYAVGLGYFNQQGTQKGNGYDRYTFRVNSDIIPKKWLKVGEALSFARETSKKGIDFADGALTGSPLMPVYNTEYTSANSITPYSTVYDPTLPLINQPNAFSRLNAQNSTIIGNNDFRNPVAANTFIRDLTEKYRIFGNVYAEIDISKALGIKAIEGLKWRSSFGVDIFTESKQAIRDKFEGGLSADRIDRTEVTQTERTNFSNVVNHLLMYNKSFANDHDLGVTVGMDAQYFRNKTLVATAQDFPQGLYTIGATQSSVYLRPDGKILENGLYGFLGRINYAYKNTYMATINARYDGSSRFANDFKYGFFPSISLGWRISNMKFMENIKIISELKLRVGWGLTGNQEIGNFRYAQVISTDIIRYSLGNTVYPGIAPTRGLANPNLKWESAQQFNAGVDVGIYKNRVLLNIDAYMKNSYDMLVPVSIPALSGATDAPYYERVSYFTNIGSISNKGLEIAILYRNESREFKYSLGPNVSFISNKVTALATDKPGQPIFDFNGVSYIEVNEPVSYFRGYVYDGVIQTQAEADSYVGNQTIAGGGLADLGVNVKKGVGDAKFKDVNNDGVLDSKDRVNIGNPIPFMNFGFSADASYKGFDFKLFLQGSVGQEIYNNQRKGLEAMDNGGGPQDKNQLVSVLDRSTRAKPTNMPLAYTKDPAQNSRPSSRWVEDGSFVRLKNIQIGYSIPAKLLTKMFKTDDQISLRFYIQAQNLITLTAYKGFDPELANLGKDANGRDVISSQVAGYDRGSYPQPRTYSVGLQFTF